MYIFTEVWWPALPPEAQQWLIAHNGEALPASVIQEITRAGGSVTSDAWLLQTFKSWETRWGETSSTTAMSAPERPDLARSWAVVRQSAATSC